VPPVAVPLLGRSRLLLHAASPCPEVSSCPAALPTHLSTHQATPHMQLQAVLRELDSLKRCLFRGFWARRAVRKLGGMQGHPALRGQREDELHRGQVRHNDDGILDALLLFRRRGAQVRAVRFVWTQQPAAVCRHDACSSSSGCQQCQTQCCRHMACSPTSSVLPCHTTGAAAAGGAVYPGCQPGAAGTHRGHPLPWPRGDAAPLHVRSSGPALSSELDPRLAWLLGCWAVRSGCCWSCQHQERLLKRELSAAA
jgi:hypothetical protein